MASKETQGPPAGRRRRRRQQGFHARVIPGVPYGMATGQSATASMNMRVVSPQGGTGSQPNSQGSQKRGAFPGPSLTEPNAKKQNIRGNRRIGRPCTISGCEMMTNFPRIHLVEVHVPAIFSQQIPLTDDLSRTRYSCLVSMAKCLLGPKANLEDLMTYINDYGYIPLNWNINDINREAMEDLCWAQGWPVPSRFVLRPLNSPACLLHWRCLTVIAEQLSKATQDDLRKRFALAIPQSSSTFEVEPAAVPREKPADLNVVPLFDSHFHLDRLRTLTKRQYASPSDLMQALPLREPASFPTKLSGGIAVFCEPETYPTQMEIDMLAKEGIRTAIGLYPRRPASAEDLRLLEKALQLHNVVALGEVGLDHSFENPDTWYHQSFQLRQALQFLTKDKVLVLHVRGQRGDPTALDTYMRCLDSLRLAGVHSEQRIQLHSFSGNREMVETWLLHYRNTYFSISGAVYEFNENQEDGLRSIPLQRILLETDAPSFPVVPEHPVSAPHMLHVTAVKVAAIMGNVTAKEVLGVAHINATELLKQE